MVEYVENKLNPKGTLRKNTGKNPSAQQLWLQMYLSKLSKVVSSKWIQRIMEVKPSGRPTLSY